MSLSKLVLPLFVITLTANAAPVDRYENYLQLKGASLKSHLKVITEREHVPRSYRELYDVYFESDLDLDYDKDRSILDIYSENPFGKDRYTFSTKAHRCGSYKKESDCFNREHIFPQGIFNKARPMRSDFFHIFPTDGKVNNRRGSLPFGEVKNPDWTSMNGSKVGPNTFGSYRHKVFEPIDEFKGDIARALFYFATRYEDKLMQWYHPTLGNDHRLFYRQWYVDLLKRWNRMDPPSKHEIRRNNAGEKFQGNRNPFIDHPEYIDQIW